ncbi:hypothetical protein CPAR01_05942 [Colletotrichum paranaense]|uniref:Uncharacterized protein n=1 Tax=Colletotrichum paranaense TaxID=1914294 RepID=A0ABQ9STB8_9PEZI|nr:uncharacterized protein CPAR01_05942 [Colletotrichum paranaense]KAK1542555.1 hypothetical protein CPAR01_05942 [Colletotrichum paranaense]
MVWTAACDFPRTPSLLPPQPLASSCLSVSSRSIRLPAISKLLFSFSFLQTTFSCHRHILFFWIPPWPSA